MESPGPTSTTLSRRRHPEWASEEDLAELRSITKLLSTCKQPCIRLEPDSRRGQLLDALAAILVRDAENVSVSLDVGGTLAVAANVPAETLGAPAKPETVGGKREHRKTTHEIYCDLAPDPIIQELLDRELGPQGVRCTKQDLLAIAQGALDDPQQPMHVHVGNVFTLLQLLASSQLDLQDKTSGPSQEAFKDRLLSRILGESSDHDKEAFKGYILARSGAKLNRWFRQGIGYFNALRLVQPRASTPPAAFKAHLDNMLLVVRLFAWCRLEEEYPHLAAALSDALRNNDTSLAGVHSAEARAEFHAVLIKALERYWTALQPWDLANTAREGPAKPWTALTAAELAEATGELGKAANLLYGFARAPATAAHLESIGQELIDAHVRAPKSHAQPLSSVAVAGGAHGGSAGAPTDAQYAAADADAGCRREARGGTGEEVGGEDPSATDVAAGEMGPPSAMHTQVARWLALQVCIVGDVMLVVQYVRVHKGAAVRPELALLSRRPDTYAFMPWKQLLPRLFNDSDTAQMVDETVGDVWAEHLNEPFNGTVHAEAYIAALLDQEPTRGPSLHIGASKRCCPVCVSFLRALPDPKSGSIAAVEFWGEHGTVTPCALPPFARAEPVRKVLEVLRPVLRQTLLEAAERQRPRPDRDDWDGLGLVAEDLLQMSDQQKSLTDFLEKLQKRAVTTS